MFSAHSDRLLADLEVYYDAVPRSSAGAEEVGPFTLFVRFQPGWPFYARPSLGATRFEAEDVLRVRARQRQLGLPETFEWVAETTPALAAAAVAGGLAVTRHPLMVLREHRAPLPEDPDGVQVRLANPDDDVALLRAIARVAFGFPGTQVGAAGLADALDAVVRDPAQLTVDHERLRSGRTVMAMALVDGQPVATGSHLPVGSVTEIAGVAVLPAYRRRGIAAAVTARLVDDALERGVRTVFLSAGDERIARVYERVGFQQVGTACAAEPVTTATDIERIGA